MKRVGKWTYLSPEAPYITFLDLGCRLKSSIGPCDLMGVSCPRRVHPVNEYVTNGRPQLNIERMVMKSFLRFRVRQRRINLQALSA